MDGGQSDLVCDAQGFERIFDRDKEIQIRTDAALVDEKPDDTQPDDIALGVKERAAAIAALNGDIALNEILLRAQNIVAFAMRADDSVGDAVL